MFVMFVGGGTSFFYPRWDGTYSTTAPVGVLGQIFI